ncbi:MAG: phosphoglucosamine mutase [Prochloraceae cyanobacterium]
MIRSYTSSPASKTCPSTSSSPAKISQKLNFWGSFPQLPQSRLFGTDGIRGKVGQLLSAPLALQLGFWAGMVLNQTEIGIGPVIIGQDSRNSSDMLAMAIASGLTGAGLEVWNLGLCPTPTVAYLTQQSDAIAGIMISASHNPPEDNGIKFFGSNGTKLPSVLTDKIEAALRNGIDPNINSLVSTAAWGKSYYRPYLIEDYISSLKRSLCPEVDFQGLRIVLDLAWGASVNIAPAVFKSLGAEVICLHELADGNKINVNCGSTHLELLQQAIQEYSADLGFAFDGDADRVMAADNRGNIVDGDYILYLWGSYLKDRGNLPDNSLVTTVMANLGFERAWQALGGKTIRTPVGDRYVQEAMFATGSMLGGEQSGHIICHHYGVSGDGLQTALHLTSLVRQSGSSLAELVEGSFTTYPQLLHNVKVEDRDRRVNWQSCDAILKAISFAEAEMGDRGRVLVRASGTEPVIRVMVEAQNQEIVNYWTENLATVVDRNLNV